MTKRRVTNQDLADMLAAMAKRLDVVEAEAKVAKWVLRLIGVMMATVLGTVINHFVKGRE